MRLKDKVVLIADDEPEIRDVIRFELEFEGAKVFEAANGTDALGCMEKNQIDVLISDIRMPGGDGIELLKKVKSLNVYTPVVLFMTGFSDLRIETAYDMGVDAVFSKPFNLNELINKVIEVAAPFSTRFSKPPQALDGVLIEQVFSDLKTAIAEGDFYLGRGGIFVKNVAARSGDHCHFLIRFQSGELLRFEGEGIVRWAKAGDTGRVGPRLGIEFEYLPDEIRSNIEDVISRLAPVAYIPAGLDRL